MQQQRTLKNQPSKGKARGTKRYSQEAKQGHIKQWQASGTEKSIYCRKHQLPLSTFKQWVKKQQAPVLQLKAVISSPALPINQNNRWYEITFLNGIKIRVSDTVDIAVLLTLSRELS